MNRDGSGAWVRFAAILLVLGLAAAANAEVRVLDTAALTEFLAAEPDQVLLLDVRTDREYARGRMGGSLLIPINQVPERLQEIPRDKKIVAVCASGARSGAVARYLDQMGYPWVANYVDGMVGWERRGLPVER